VPSCWDAKDRLPGLIEAKPVPAPALPIPGHVTGGPEGGFLNALGSGLKDLVDPSFTVKVPAENVKPPPATSTENSCSKCHDTRARCLSSATRKESHAANPIALATSTHVPPFVVAIAVRFERIAASSHGGRMQLIAPPCSTTPSPYTSPKQTRCKEKCQPPERQLASSQSLHRL